MKSILKQPQKSRDSELAKYLGISIKEVSKWPINAKSTKRILDRKKTIMSNGKVDNNKVVDFHLRFGASKFNEDELNFYFNITKDDYLKSKKRYNKFFL